MNLNDVANFIIDKPGETFQVNRRLFTDPQLFQLEMKYIYEKVWIYMAHESEIPNAYDYMTGWVGRKPIMISRDQHGELRGFINACTHRGATLCRTKVGNTKKFMCSYHGWVFDTHGNLLAIKGDDRGGYNPAYFSRSHDLQSVRVQSYKGFVFATLNEEAPALPDYLAGAKEYIDLFADQSPEGMEVIPGRSIYRHYGNWKMQAENGVDGYHPDIVHRSYFKIVENRVKALQKGKTVDDKVKAIDFASLMSMPGASYDLGNGHCAIWSDFANWQQRPLYERYEELCARVGEVKARWMCSKVRHVLIYPNVIFLDGNSTQIRAWRPLSENETEVTIRCIAPRGESREARARRIRQYEDFYGASGIATPDDLAEFAACQDGAKGLDSVYQEYDRGIATCIAGPDENALELGLQPTITGTDFTSETLYHGQYRQWHSLIMQGLARDGGLA